MLGNTLFILFVLGWTLHGKAASAQSPSSTPPRPVERLARFAEPDLVGRAERLPQYVDLYRRELANDTRLFAFDVTADVDADGQVQLRGYVQFPEMSTSVAQYLGLLGFEVEDRLEMLPAENLGERIFGFVKTTNSLSYDRPIGRREVVTDCLLGEPLYLLREEEGHLLVHSGEGYLGYVRTADVHRVDESQFARYMDGPSILVHSDHQTSAGLVVPAGTRLKWVGEDNETVIGELPTGESVTLPAAVCEVRQVPVAEIDHIVDSAKQLVGTPYLWGGKTSQGVDCSGLMQVAFATAGLHLPRDSNQQFYVGKLTATRWHTAGLRRGDTLYFLGADGRIRHTGIYLGDDRFLHAVQPVVRINSFNPEHDDYAPRQHASFAFAKRLLE